MNGSVKLVSLAFATACGAAVALSAAGPYVAGLTFRGGGRCPSVVWGVLHGSPAERAGIAVGDHLLAIEGVSTREMRPRTVPQLIQSDSGGVVRLTLSRGNREYRVGVDRELQSVLVARTGRKVYQGIVVPEDTTAAELAAMAGFDGSRVVEHVFPMHYPSDLECYSGGFELFVLREPAEVAVGGIELGPAQRAGLHWGDSVLEVNGGSLAGKTTAELARLFCGPGRQRLDLTVRRSNAVRQVAFSTERTADLLRANGLQLVGSALVPIGVSPKDAQCLDSQE